MEYILENDFGFYYQAENNTWISNKEKATKFATLESLPESIRLDFVDVYLQGSSLEDAVYIDDLEYKAVIRAVPLV